MKRLLRLAIFLLSGPLHAQGVDWSRVDINIQRLNPKLRPARLDPHTRASILRVVQRSADPASGDVPDAQTVEYLSAPLGLPGVIYVDMKPGSGRSVNGSIWLVHLAGNRPVILADPRQGFAGWGLGVQPHVSRGLHDVVLGWHMSAFETPLAYFRFDGRRYHRIASQDLKRCETMPGHERELGECLENGRRAFNSGSY